MLILSRKAGESVMIGDDIELSIIELRGDQVKIGVQAPRSVKVYRREVFDLIQEENKAAASSGAAIPSIDLGSLGTKR